MSATTPPIFSEIPVVFLVVAGRDGGGFMQSLLDSHPQILMLPMELNFYDLWEEIGAEDITDPAQMVKALCTESKLRKLAEGVHYGYREGEDDYTPCDFLVFKQHLMALLTEHGLARRTVFLSLQHAYAKSIGQDITKVKCVVEFTVFPGLLPQGLADFQDARLLQIVRDPRGSFASAKNGFIRTYGILFHPKADKLDHKLLHSFILDCLRLHHDILRSLKENVPAERFLIVRLDDLHLDIENTMRRVADWLEIDYAPCLLESTIGGKAWLGNSSTGKPVSGVNPPILTRWKETLIPREVALIESLFEEEIRTFGWKRQERRTSLRRDLIRCLLPFPGEFSYTPVSRKAGNRHLKALEAVHPSLVALVRAVRAWFMLVPQAVALYPYSRLRLTRLVAKSSGIKQS